MSDFDGLGVLPGYDEPLDTDLLLRQSTIESMMLCPARVGYSTHPDYDNTPSEAMFFGSAAHALIEHRLVNGDRLGFHSPTWVETFVRELAQEKDGFNIADVTTPVTLKAFVQELIVSYSEWVSQWWAYKQHSFKPLVIEERLIRPLGTLPNGRAVWVHGTPDVLHQPGMVDWKTAGRGWQAGKGEVRIQTPTYLWLGESIRGTSTGIGEYVVYDRSNQQWSTFEVHVGPEQVDAALRTLWEYSKQIDAGIYPPTPAAPAGRMGRGWWCQPKFCNAWDLCEFKGLVADDMNLTQVRISSWAA